MNLNKVIPVNNNVTFQGASTSNRGFSLLELMIAMVITLIITGAMYGMIAQGQGAFQREPERMDRQQQIRIAMDRIQEDVLTAGQGFGGYFQSFGPGLNAVGVAGAAGLAQTGVRPAGDAALGGGFPDALDIRAPAADCPMARAMWTGTRQFSTAFPAAGNLPWPTCFATPSYVTALYPNGEGKFAFLPDDPARTLLNFDANVATQGSQMLTNSENALCARFLATAADHCPGDPAFGIPAPPATEVSPFISTPAATPVIFAKTDRIIYRIGLDTDGTPSLFRSASGGYDSSTGAFDTIPPGTPAAWTLVARGIEDLQVRYRTAAGWLDTPPAIVAPVALAAGSYDNVVREVEITLWARTPAENAPVAGDMAAAGNGVRATRGSLITSVAPRAAQMALANELDATKRWQ